MTEVRTVFMGSPAFAAAVLKALCENGENIVGVVTQTDKPKGRGYKLIPSDVKEYALTKGLNILQPKTLRTAEAFEDIKALQPDLIIVVAYGKILPCEILNLPPLGCINIHGSLLPEYRGAAPVQRCIMDGRKKTGVTLMHMDEGCDTGDMIEQAEIEITPEMNCGDVFEKMADEGIRLLLKNLPAIKNGTCKCVPQNCKESNYAHKIEKSELLLDFNKPAETLHNLVRGVYPYLTCECVQHTEKGDRKLKLVKTSFSEENSGAKPGEVTTADAKSGKLAVCCGNGTLFIHELIPEGKNKMSASDYIRGRQIKEKDILI